MQKSQLYKELIMEYDRKRTASRLELSNRKNDIYERLPRIKEIDDEIARLGISAATKALASPETAGESAELYESRCVALLNEKDAILKEHRIPKKYMEVYYACEKCKDTGFINRNECTCFINKRIEKAYNLYSLKDKLETENFNNFDFRYYSDAPLKGYADTPRKNMEKIYSFSTGYTKSFGAKYENVLFYGNPGLGKTFVCNCISKELMDKGFFVVYLTAFQLFKFLEDTHFDRGGDLYIMEDIFNSDLLIIDDLGTEFSTVITNSGFFNIVNSRANAKKPVIISTNLQPEEIKIQYSERIHSRIAANYSAFEFYGENVGLLKKYGKFLS